MNGLHTTMAKSGLVRGDDRWLGGVCSGLARKFGTDPGAVRLIMVLLLLLPGSQLIVYPLLWFVMPDEATAQRLLGAEQLTTYRSGGSDGTAGPQDQLP
ncbi:MAG: PspC domain-containing protein [Austwickia sp.]|nr:PspC domain-containing protein [Actinomycetota bacterium]MCB1252359.1 PspC domain-containing protein [Austwickia sp.]